MATVNMQQMKLPSEENLRLFANLIISLSSQTSSLEQRCIEPWKANKTYAKNVSFVSYDNAIWFCKTTCSDSVWTESHWEKQSDTLTEIDKTTLESWINLNPEQVINLQNLILDSEVRLDKTWSSSKTYTSIQQCLDDSKTYTLEQIAQLSGASYSVVTDTASMTDERIIYLLQNGATFDMYIVDGGTPTKIGDTSINLSDFYSKLEADGLFLKIADATTIYATKTEMDYGLADKVDKSKILPEISITPSNENILSELGVKAELDKKANDDEIVKTSDIITTIDSTSTNNQIPSAKAVYDMLTSYLTDSIQIVQLYNTTYYTRMNKMVTGDVNNTGSGIVFKVPSNAKTVSFTIKSATKAVDNVKDDILVQCGSGSNEGTLPTLISPGLNRLNYKDIRELCSMTFDVSDNSLVYYIGSTTAYHNVEIVDIHISEYK